MQRRSRDRNVRTFEFMMRSEKRIREAVKEAKANKGGHTGGTPTGHAFIPDPTASEAIRNAEELRFVELGDGGKVEWPERWLRVIDAVRAWCEPSYLRREILRRRYSGESWTKTCAELTISRERYLSETRYREIIRSIRSYALQCAAQVQVIKVF